MKNIVDVAFFSLFYLFFIWEKNIILFIDFRKPYWLKFGGLFFTWGLRQLHLLLTHSAGPDLCFWTRCSYLQQPGGGHWCNVREDLTPLLGGGRGSFDLQKGCNF